MRVTVKLFATFRKGRFDAEVREVPPGTTVSNVVDGMRLPESIGIIFVNRCTRCLAVRSGVRCSASCAFGVRTTKFSGSLFALFPSR